MTKIILDNPIGKQLPNRDTDLLHYKFRTPLLSLLEALRRAYESGRTQSDFHLFEGFRDPGRQNAVFEAGSSKARAWQSAHQYGLAADIVAVREGKWTWDASEDWRFLKRTAGQFGLSVPIEWDRCHVQSPVWAQVRKVVM